MVAGGLFIKLSAVVDAAALKISGSENNPCDSCEGNRCCAHGAGFKGDVQGVIGDTLRPCDLAALADDHHFGVGGGVAELPCSITISGNDFTAFIH